MTVFSFRFSANEPPAFLSENRKLKTENPGEEYAAIRL